MDHDGIAELLRRTPAALPEPVPDPTALLRLYRGRRTRRLFASSLVAVVAAAGGVAPLGLLANVGSGPHPPSATISRPTTTDASALPTVANLTCIEAGIRVESPAFAVQPDGPHLDV